MEVGEKAQMSEMVQTSTSRNKQLVVGNTVYSSAYDFQVTDEELQKAYRELNERENEKENCIRNLREKLKKEKEIIYRTDDHYLLCNLRYRKYDCNRAFDTIRRSHDMKIKYKELFALPSNLESLLARGFTSWLPYRDEHGRIIITVEFRKWKLEEMTFEEMIQSMNAATDVITMNPHCQINGTVGLWNFKGLTAKHLAHFANPILMWNLANLLQDTYPNRIKLVILVNCHRMMRGAYNAIKFLLKKKIVDRIKMIDSDVNEIHKYLNPALLPKEFGGTLEEEECHVTQYIMDNLSYLLYSRSFTATSDNALD